MGRNEKIMRIGIFADAHDHVDNVRHAVRELNQAQCELVIFAGDFVSPLVVPPLRKLNCPVMACFGDSDGNKIGLEGGMRIIGCVGEPPLCLQTDDGLRIIWAHFLDDMRGMIDDCDIVISAHTHRPKVHRDESGRLFINPGETGGWFFRKPTIAVLETETLETKFISLPDMPPMPADE